MDTKEFKRNENVDRDSVDTTSENTYKNQGSNPWNQVGIAAEAVAGGGPMMLGVPIGVTGFPSTGIVPGSLAAKIMSQSAMLNGGGVIASGILYTNDNAYCEFGENGLKNIIGNQGLNTWTRVAGAVVGSGVLLIAAPLVVSGLGFTTTGIAASSLATKMMSIFAYWNGGGVAAGGLVAILQSIGAAGFGIAGNVILAGGGGVAGERIANKLTKPSEENKPAGNNDDGNNEGNDDSASNMPRE